MGELVTPTSEDRAETRAVAKRWLDAVRDDMPMPVDIRAVYGDVNGFITALCQELEARDAEMGEVRAARDEALEDTTAGKIATWLDAHDPIGPDRLSNTARQIRDGKWKR